MPMRVWMANVMFGLLFVGALGHGADTIYYSNQYDIGGLKYNVGSISSNADKKPRGYVEIGNLGIAVKSPKIDFLQSKITHCAVANNNLYALLKVDVRPVAPNENELSPRQGLLYVCKINKDSQECKQVVSNFYDSQALSFYIKDNIIMVRGTYRKKDTYKYLDFNTSLEVFLNP